MCISRNPVSVMRTSVGRFSARAWQATVMTLELEKAIQGSRQPNVPDILGGIDFCEAVLAGSRWSPTTSPVDFYSADSVALFAELQKHAGPVERTEGVMETLRMMMGDENRPRPSPDQMKSAQEFFLRASEVINIARDTNPS